MLNEDPKLSSVITTGTNGDLMLIGFPYDEGVVRNGGRSGSRHGPSCFRKFLSSVGSTHNSEHGISLESFTISDLGDIEPSEFSSLETAHDELYAQVKHSLLLKQRPSVFVVGGGSDQSLASGKGFIDYCALHRYKPVIINVDAHLDVRGLNDCGEIHSDCQFRLILENQDFHELGGKLIEFASQGSQCAGTHVEYVRKKGGELYWLSQTRNRVAEALGEILDALGEDCKVFLSFDLDAVGSSFCPGVSEPAVGRGLTGDEALAISFIAGSCPRVVLMDASEYNPVVEDYRTGKLLATMFYYFTLGRSTLCNSE